MCGLRRKGVCARVGVIVVVKGSVDECMCVSADE